MKFNVYRQIDMLASINSVLRELSNLLAKSSTRYGMEISTGNSLLSTYKLMVNSDDNSIHVNITLYGNKLEEVMLPRRNPLKRCIL